MSIENRIKTINIPTSNTLEPNRNSFDGGFNRNQDSPKVNQTHQMTGDELRKKLEGYLPVTDFMALPYNTHIRYFLKNDQGKWVFRIGGFLKKQSDDIVFLCNTPMPTGGRIWKVSKNNGKFYYKPKPDARPANWKTSPTDLEYKINQLSNSGNNQIGSGIGQQGFGSVGQQGFASVGQQGFASVGQQGSGGLGLSQANNYQSQMTELIRESDAIKEVNRQYRFALEQQQKQIQLLRQQLLQLK